MVKNGTDSYRKYRIESLSMTQNPTFLSLSVRIQDSEEISEGEGHRDLQERQRGYQIVFDFQYELGFKVTVCGANRRKYKKK